MRGATEELTVASGPWFRDRRTWEAYHTKKTFFTQSVSQAVSLPLWQRIRRHRLRHALKQWKRVDRILAAQEEFRRLVEKQRSYLLRKLLLTRYWRSVSVTFGRWVRVCRCYVRLERQVQTWRRKTAMGVAMNKWRHSVRTERLEEKAVACVSVLATRKVERFSQRVTRRTNSERLVSCWVQWKAWHRRQCCRAWRHGLSLAMGKHFVAWKHFHNAARLKKQQLEAFARGIIVSCIDDSAAQCLWRQRVRDQQTDRLVEVITLLSRWIDRVQLGKLNKSLSVWKAHASDTKETTSDENPNTPPTPPPVAHKLRFPERFTATYRDQQRRERSTTDWKHHTLRPQWR